ncbi:MAG: YbaK/EbsC family protein [Bacteroidetes bacterium]|nr:YbaK/EbsC family protein [Bacteroidota bacterium]
MATIRELLTYLSDNDIEFSVLKHGQIKSAQEISGETKLPIKYVIQTVPVHVGGQSWMIVLPADRVIDFNSLCEFLKTKDIKEDYESEWPQYFPNLEIYTVPPFGNLFGFKVLADESLKERKRIAFSACSDTESVFMRWNDYERLVKPQFAKITIEPAAGVSAETENINDILLSGASDYTVLTQKI